MRNTEWNETYKPDGHDRQANILNDQNDRWDKQTDYMDIDINYMHDLVVYKMKPKKCNKANDWEKEFIELATDLNSKKKTTK